MLRFVQGAAVGKIEKAVPHSLLKVLAGFVFAARTD